MTPVSVLVGMDRRTYVKFNIFLEYNVRQTSVSERPMVSFVKVNVERKVY